MTSTSKNDVTVFCAHCLWIIFVESTIYSVLSHIVFTKQSEMFIRSKCALNTERYEYLNLLYSFESILTSRFLMRGVTNNVSNATFVICRISSAAAYVATRFYQEQYFTVFSNFFDIKDLYRCIFQVKWMKYILFDH